MDRRVGWPIIVDSSKDRFIAGHSSCELRRHLDSVPPKTPIRDVVDRCHVWESHADPAVRRVSKPSPEPTYPDYVVGDADRTSDGGQRRRQVGLLSHLGWQWTSGGRKTAADPRGGAARDPGGGTVSPRWMTIDDYFSYYVTVRGGGGEPQLVPSRVSTVWTEETMAGDTPGRECLHDDVGIRSQMGTVRISDDQVPSRNIELPYGGGA